MNPKFSKGDLVSYNPGFATMKHPVWKIEVVDTYRRIYHIKLQQGAYRLRVLPFDREDKWEKLT